MDLTRTVAATERTGDAGRMDRRTDRRRDGVKPIYPPTTLLCRGIIMQVNCWRMQHDWHCPIKFVRDANVTVMSHEHQGILNHWQLNCLFISLFRIISNKVMNPVDYTPHPPPTPPTTPTPTTNFVGQGYNKHIKSPHYRPDVSETHWLLVEPPHKGTVMQKTSPCHQMM